MIRPLVSNRFPVLFLMLSSYCLCAALSAASAADASSPHADASSAVPSSEALVPIADVVRGVRLDDLAAVPVQHGGRYKALHALGMETCNAIGGSTTLGEGHTPLSSLLDLIFCRADYERLPIVRIKHAELAHDLALIVPVGEQQRLNTDRRLTPERVRDPVFQERLDQLGRFTTKAKAISQVRWAAANVDSKMVLENLRIFPVPAGAHSDHWRGPADVAPAFNLALEDFIARASAAHGNMNAFIITDGQALPLSDSMAQQMKMSADDQRRVNMSVLWPLWKAAGAGQLRAAQASALIHDTVTVAAQVGLSSDCVNGLTQLSERWADLSLAADVCADPAQQPRCADALNRAAVAWINLGSGWAAARHGHVVHDLQNRIDAVVQAVGTLRELLDHDRVQRGWEPLAFNTHLELTYWRWNGFTGVAWLFLCAVPLLALGSIGRMRWALWIGLSFFAVGAVGQMVAFGIRWRLAERIPLANLYESMAAAALLASLVALVVESCSLARRSSATAVGHVVAPAKGQAAGAIALAASLFGCIIVMSQAFLERHDINAFISPAMPILSEFWLRIHTACVVSSYGLISLGGLMSIVYLLMRCWLPWNDTRAQAWDRTTFALNGAASVVLWTGLVLGAVWAAASWGRPWGWDPKEVFALLTWVVFVMLIHLRVAVRIEQRGIATAWVSLFAFLVMGFNWYFVNVRLAGLHSYA